MKVINCIWELANIGKRTVEIVVDPEDFFHKESFESAIADFEYAVVKVPMNKPEFNFGLSHIGFSCIETQMNMKQIVSEFDFSKVQELYDYVDFEIVKTEQDFNSVISMITPGMFSTDRISIDPEFGHMTGCNRYTNWITTEYRNGKSSLIRVIYKKEHIGFMLIKIEGDDLILLLNGLYKPYQGKGLGVLTPASPLLYIKQEKMNVISERTSISSNNIPVVKLYNRLLFQIESQSYVFIRHSHSAT